MKIRRRPRLRLALFLVPAGEGLEGNMGLSKAPLAHPKGLSMGRRWRLGTV
jgi:hypothetical protein